MKNLILIIFIILSVFANSQNKYEIDVFNSNSEIKIKYPEDNYYKKSFNEKYIGIGFTYNNRISSYFIGYNYKYKQIDNKYYSSEKFQIPFGVRFNFFKKWFRPYLGITIYNNFIYNEKHLSHYSGKTYGPSPVFNSTMHRTYIENLFDYEMGINPSIGLNLIFYKRVNLRIETNFQINKSTIEYIGDYKQHYFTISLGYCFEKLKK